VSCLNVSGVNLIADLTLMTASTTASMMPFRSMTPVAENSRDTYRVRHVRDATIPGLAHDQDLHRRS
jgi:hypothetical protein